jgi:hypothetical protein
LNAAAGGVCIFVSNKLISSCINIDYAFFNDAEIVACSLVINDNKFSIVCAYIPPNLINEHFISSINCIRSVLYVDISCFILGDFNLPHIDWSNIIFPRDFKCQALFNLYTDFGLSQLILEPTHGLNTLDLLFTNEPLLITDFAIDAPFSSSDHESFYFAVYCESSIDVHDAMNNNRPGYFWKHADWPSFANYCGNIDWINMFSGCSNSDDCWSKFDTILNNGCNYFVPKHCNKPITTRQHCKPVRRLLEKKKLCWQEKRTDPSAANVAKYKLAEANLKRSLHAEAEYKEHCILSSGNLGLFYNHVNHRMVHKSGIAPLKNNSGTLSTLDGDKANILNDFFVGVGTIDNDVLPKLTDDPKAVDFFLGMTYFDAGSLVRNIRGLNGKSAAGPDGFPPILFKELVNQLCEPLAMMFRLIMQFGVLPQA